MFKKRNHEKLKKEQNIFRCYKCFDKETIIKDKELARRYEEELILLLKEKFNCKNLEEFIHKLEEENPFDNGYVAREIFDDKIISDRISLKNQDKVKNPFSYILNDSKGNSLEAMIQRHIMLSDKYNEVLGKPLFYEFPCNTSNNDIAKDKQGKVPIDLITYDEKNKIIYLIELKKCKGCNTCKRGNLSESNELFLRALLEVTTYYSFFIHLLNVQKELVEEVLSKVGNVNVNFADIKVRKAILAPKVVFDNVYTEELKKELSKIDCFVIKPISDDISKICVNTHDKVFEISRYE